MKKKMLDNIFIEYLKTKYNIKYNSGQLEFVLSIIGSILVIAVPGAGKTFAICGRLFNMIFNYNIDPSKILAITFSKASAIDMDRKFNELFLEELKSCDKDYDNHPMKFSTIHAFAYKIVLDYYKKHDKQIRLIEEKKKSILNNIYLELENESITDDTYEKITSHISLFKNQLLTNEEIKNICSTKEEYHKDFYEIYTKYEKYKRENNYIDFDDMLCLALDFLNNDEQIREKYSSLYDYIVIDEGQDTSVVQFLIMQIIASKGNICVVGDDDQCIYEWRSADVDNFLYFDKYFPNTKKIFMEENFRSTKKITKLSNEFIKNNTKRYKKEIFTNNEEGENIKIIECENYNSQIDYLVNSFQKETNLSNNAILYRNNLSAFLIANKLIENRIPFYIRDFKRNFFTHWIITDIKNFINIIINPYDKTSFNKIAFKINQYISKKMLYYVINSDDSIFNSLINYPELKVFQKKKYITLKQEIDKLKEKSIPQIIDYFCDDLGYLEKVEEICKDLGFSFESQKEIIYIFKDLTSQSTLNTFFNNINEFENTLNQSRNNYKGNVVTLTTCHSSKGLEWNKVYIIDLCNNIFPSFFNLKDYREGNPLSLESERRLFYVGLTRAKKELFLLYPLEKNNEKQQYSIFLSELLSVNNKINIIDLYHFNNKTKQNLFNNKLEKIKNLTKNSTNNFNKSQTSLFDNNKNNNSKTILKNTIDKKSSQTNKKDNSSLGKKITHVVFGEGIVIAEKDSLITVKFKDGSIKKINMNVCLRKKLII